MSDPIFRVRTPGKHTHSIAFSPYFPKRLAAVLGQFYGIAGSGSLHVIDLPDAVPNHVEHGSAFATQQLMPQVQEWKWNDALFDLSWSEHNEHVIVTGAGDGSVQAYDTTSQEKGPIAVVKEHSKEVASIDWCQNRIYSHLFITSSWDQTLKIWDGTSMKCLTTLSGAHDRLIYEARSSPLVAGLFASVSGDSSLRVWSMMSCQQPVVSIPSHNAEVLSVDWSKYNQDLLATSGTDGLVKIWDVRNPQQPVAVLEGHRYAVRRVRFSPHTPCLIMTASYDFSTIVWDFTVQSQPMKTYNHHSEFVCGLDFNLHIPQQVADGSWDESICIWNI